MIRARIVTEEDVKYVIACGDEVDIFVDQICDVVNGERDTVKRIDAEVFGEDGFAFVPIDVYQVLGDICDTKKD